MNIATLITRITLLARLAWGVAQSTQEDPHAAYMTAPASAPTNSCTTTLPDIAVDNNTNSDSAPFVADGILSAALPAPTPAETTLAAPIVYALAATAITTITQKPETVTVQTSATIATTNIINILPMRIKAPLIGVVYVGIQIVNWFKKKRPTTYNTTTAEAPQPEVNLSAEPTVIGFIGTPERTPTMYQEYEGYTALYNTQTPPQPPSQKPPGSQPPQQSPKNNKPGKSKTPFAFVYKPFHALFSKIIKKYFSNVQGIAKTTLKDLEHILQNHIPGGIIALQRALEARKNSLFKPEVNIVVQAEKIAEYCKDAWEKGTIKEIANGLIIKVYDCGKIIGWDKNGNETSLIKIVVQKAFARIISAYPFEK